MFDLYFTLMFTQHNKSILSELKVVCQNVLFEVFGHTLCNMCTRSERRVLKRLECVCWWGNDHVIWSASRLSGWLWLLSSGSSGHLLYLHLNTDLRPAASLCILIALASFAVCHWLLSLISIPHAPPPWHQHTNIPMQSGCC